MAQVGKQRSEVRGRRSGVRDQRTEDRDQRSGVRSQRVAWTNLFVRGNQGLAMAMRTWMRERGRMFSPRQICEGLNIPPGGRQRVRNSLPDFIKRGEVERVAVAKYRYNKSWKPAGKGRIKPRIIKAMYVSTTFTVSDLQRLTGQKDRSYIDRIMCEIRRTGYIKHVGRRPCAHGAGAERLWQVVNRDRFRVEVMG